MDSKINISKVDFFKAGKRSELGVDLQESTPVFLSGPAGQGKEMIQGLLTYWYLPNPQLLETDKDYPNLLLYQWAGIKKEFVSVHASISGNPVFMLISGSIEGSWGNENAIPALEKWKKELAKEGRVVSKILNGQAEWDRWLTHQKSPLPKKQQDLFPSPAVNPDSLQLLRYRPEAQSLSWEQVFANRLLHLLNIPEEFQQKILSYHHERTALHREEQLGRSLPGLRKWDHRKEQIKQERQLLTSQWPGIYDSHQIEKETLQENLLNTELPLPEEDRLEQLRMRLGWIQWEMEQKTTIVTSKAPVETPAIWWKARKILASEQQEIVASIRKIQDQLMISPQTDSTDEEIRIEAQLRRLDQQLPEKIAALERLNMKLEWLRKEKAEEEQTLKNIHHSELARLQHEREGLEELLKKLETEARRPRNTFRHWLEKNYPDWENGPGKVLHPSVLESRGMFPTLERINDLFFGVRIHLDELPEVEPTQTQNQNPGYELEQVRHSIATFQIQVQHEEKLLQNRYKQKIRPLQKSIQQADYDLQLHSRTQHQLRQQKKEIRQQLTINREKKRLTLEYRLNELQELSTQLTQQVRDLDYAWEGWLTENSQPQAEFSLDKLEAKWKKDLIQQEKRVIKARKKAEDTRLLATAALDSWTLRDNRFSNLIANQELSKPDTSEHQPASLTIEQWEQRWELMEAEEISWDQEHQSWVEEYPDLQEYLNLGLEEFDESEIAIKKSELARSWFGKLSEISQMLVQVRNVYAEQVKTWELWREVWDIFTKKSSLSEFSPQVHIVEHPFWRAIDMLTSLIEDHQHAAAGAGLFNQQDPQQTLIRTLNILDNLFDGWLKWKDGLTRMNLNILRLPGLHQPHRQIVFNYLYHLSLIFSQPGNIPGLVPIPEPDKIPTEVIKSVAGRHKWVISSQYPLAVKGAHLWVTEGKKDKQWEALPFAMG